MDIVDIVEKQLDIISRIDKNGDNFRYPTSYSLEYRIDNRVFDLKNIYEFMRALLNFFEGCDSMLNAIADYESEMHSYYSGYY